MERQLAKAVGETKNNGILTSKNEAKKKTREKNRIPSELDTKVKKGCGCKGNCSNKKCGCVKKGVNCGENCNCSIDKCKNQVMIPWFYFLKTNSSFFSFLT